MGGPQARTVVCLAEYEDELLAAAAAADDDLIIASSNPGKQEMAPGRIKVMGVARTSILSPTSMPERRSAAFNGEEFLSGLRRQVVGVVGGGEHFDAQLECPGEQFVVADPGFTTKFSAERVGGDAKLACELRERRALLVEDAPYLAGGEVLVVGGGEFGLLGEAFRCRFPFRVGVFAEPVGSLEMLAGLGSTGSHGCTVTYVHACR